MVAIIGDVRAVPRKLFSHDPSVVVVLPMQVDHRVNVHGGKPGLRLHDIDATEIRK